MRIRQDSTAGEELFDSEEVDGRRRIEEESVSDANDAVGEDGELN